MCYGMSIIHRCCCHDIALSGGYRNVVFELYLPLKYRYRLLMGITYSLIFVCNIWLSLLVHLILEFETEHKVRNCSQFNVSEPEVYLGECLIMTVMIEAYIILIEAGRSLGYALLGILS